MYRIIYKIIMMTLIIWFGLAIVLKLIQLDFDRWIMGYFFPVLIIYYAVTSHFGDDSSRKWLGGTLIFKGLIASLGLYRAMKLLYAELDMDAETEQLLLPVLVIPIITTALNLATGLFLLLTGKLYRRHFMVPVHTIEIVER